MVSLSVLRMRPWSAIALALAGLGLAAGACSSSESTTPPSSASSSSSSAAAGGGSPVGSGGAGPSSTTSSTSGGSPSTSSGSGTGGSGTGGAGTCPPEPTGPVPPLQLTVVASNLRKPVYAIGAPGDPSRLFIVEQTGLIKIVKDGTLLPDPFLSTVGISNSGSDPNSERGLLGLVFHPNYQENGRLFIYYTASGSGAITIAEYARSAENPDRANAQATRTLVQISEGLHPWGNHNGGMLAFGPDGYLYAGIGDGGGQGDPNGHGQDLSVKLGKLLRLDVDNHPAAPPGNMPGGDPHIWDYGLRNPWRFSFDRCTGDLYIGDVGQGQLEEVDVEPAGQGGKNYGWDTTEGTRCYASSTCDTAGITMPIAEYRHNSDAPYDGKCSVTGGYVYRGSNIPNLVGTYLYADYCSNQIWSLVWRDGAVVEQRELSGDLRVRELDLVGISSFGEDARGELYVVDIGGTVYRIDPE